MHRATTRRSSSVSVPKRGRCGVRPRATSSATDVDSGTTGRCGIRPTRRASTLSPARDGSAPATEIRPVYGSSPPTACSSDVLPAPLGPTRQTHSPAATRRSTSCTTLTPPRVMLTAVHSTDAVVPAVRDPVVALM